MHEMSIAYALLKIVEDRARDNGIVRVTLVRVKVGRLRALESRQLRAAFEVLADGSLAAGATLDIDETPAKARCKRCANEWRPVGFRLDCPECGGGDAEIVEGRELHIESFDGEREP